MRPLQITMETQFDLVESFLVNKHYCVVKDTLDASGFKVYTRILLELMLDPSTD